MRPAAYASVGLAAVFSGLAIHQGLVAKQASTEASAMVGSDGSLAAGSDPIRYQTLRDQNSAASRNAYLSAGAAVVFAGTAAVLGWKSRARPEDAGTLALAF
jgi:hypothetical protein